jgi:hypothetical protein
MVQLGFIKQNVKCCISGRSLADCEYVNVVTLDMKATWSFPVWSNILTGASNMAVAYVHDDYMNATGQPTEPVQRAVEIDGAEIRYHDVVRSKPWNIYKQGFDISTYAPLSADRIKQNRQYCINVFAASLHGKFRVLDTEIVDEIVSVDFENLLVIGNNDSYHIDVCQLTSPEKFPAANRPIINALLALIFFLLAACQVSRPVRYSQQDFIYKNNVFYEDGERVPVHLVDGQKVSIMFFSNRVTIVKDTTKKSKNANRSFSNR